MLVSSILQSGLHPNQVDYINAHATSTPLGKLVGPSHFTSLCKSRCIENAKLVLKLVYMWFLLRYYLIQVMLWKPVLSKLYSVNMQHQVP